MIMATTMGIRGVYQGGRSFPLPPNMLLVAKRFSPSLRKISSQNLFSPQAPLTPKRGGSFTQKLKDAFVGVHLRLISPLRAADLYSKLGILGVAQLLLERATKIERANVPMHLKLGQVYYHRGELEKAG